MSNFCRVEFNWNWSWHKYIKFGFVLDVGFNLSFFIKIIVELSHNVMGFFGIPGSFHVNKGENMLAKASKKRSSSNRWRDFCVTMTTVAGYVAKWRTKAVGLFCKQ